MCCSCNKGYFSQMLGKNFLMIRVMNPGINTLGRLKSLQLEDFKDGLNTHCLGVTQVF